MKRSTVSLSYRPAVFARLPRPVACVLLAIAACGGDDSYELIQRATMRNVEVACAQSSREFEATFAREPDVDFDEFRAPWCGELVQDGRMYCFLDTDPQWVTRRMYDTGLMIAVRPDHPDLPCWTAENAQWQMAVGPDGKTIGPLRELPREPLPEGV